MISDNTNTTKDYSSYLNFLACYTLLGTWQFVAFYRMKQKRTKEDNRRNGVEMNDRKNTSTSTNSQTQQTSKL